MTPLTMSLLSALIISSISLLTLFLFFTKVSFINKITIYLVAFAVGSLLGDSFLHLLPESFEQIESAPTTSLLVILGMIIFFSLEKFLRWRHCHDASCQNEHHGPIVTLNLVGDTVHNLIDGMLIAASFMVSPALGFTTTLAVAFHELPQEFGDFSIFIHSGVSIAKTIKYNFISALFSVFGVLITFAIGSAIKNFSLYLLPVTAGGFIYLASSDLIPELHRQPAGVLSSVIQLLLLILGVGLMFSLLFLE